MDDGRLSDLIRRAREGDEEAAKALVQRYEGQLQAAIRAGIGRDLRSRLSASDVFQATMFAALRELEHFEYHGEAAFTAWLNTIAERQLLMAARYHSARKRDVGREQFVGTSPVHPDDQPSPSAAAVHGEMTALIRHTVVRLPTLERRVVELHSFEGHSFARVADELSLSGAARARYLFQRALKAMGRMLDDLGG
ncbi:MAG: sigma-70 family RNA polymerase sigma factor [Planctomycetota bacterium]|jgi:RNA polymerase sigma-70 factor (ECF subfamily)